MNPQLWAALDTVRDPELDEPVTDLGFVHSATLAEGHAEVRLRLPTYFCAPNFAYLMVADAHDAVTAVEGVTSVDIRLDDHFASEEINAGVAGQAGFEGTFPTEAIGELDELRLIFRRKAYLAGLDRLGTKLVQDGRTPAEIAGLTLGDVPASPVRSSLIRRRRDLDIDCGPDAPLLVDEKGMVIPAGEAALRLRFARAVRISIDGNAGLCRGLLQTRYSA